MGAGGQRRRELGVRGCRVGRIVCLVEMEGGKREMTCPSAFWGLEQVLAPRKGSAGLSSGCVSPFTKRSGERLVCPGA